MNLVILAAGYGTRINENSEIPKGLIKIKDKSIIETNIENINDVINISKLILITNKKYFNLYDDFLNIFDIKYEILINNSIERGNGYSFFLAKQGVNTDEFILIMSDHVFSKSFIRSAILGRGLAVDSDPIYVDYDDATKVLTDSKGRIKKIGKKLKNYNFIDTGFFILNKNIFSYSDEIELLHDKFGVSDIIRKAKINIIDVTKNTWVDIDTKKDLKVAKELFTIS